MSDTVIKVENLSKQYRLGTVGTGSLAHDLNRIWHRLRGNDDPYLKIGETNDRTQKGISDYVWALRDINFEVKRGEVMGIIGRNGAGKSTLLKILSRTTTPTIGSVKIKGRVASLLEVGTGFHPELSGRENIYLNGAILGMTRHEIKNKFDEIIDFAGVERYIDTPVKRYSSGMYVRLAFGVAAHLEPEILIVDEVLAVGDAEFQKKALGKMKDVSNKEGRTVLFVSHNISAIKQLCSNVVLLEDGRIGGIGPTDQMLDKYLKPIGKVNKLEFINGPLTDVAIYQENDILKIEAGYISYLGLDIPNLGFVIYNSHDIPIFGSNPVFQNISIDPLRTFKKGRIVAFIKNPKLTNGEYHASIWFGDSKTDYFEAIDSIYFEVVSTGKIKQMASNIAGNIEPEITWHFTKTI